MTSSNEYTLIIGFAVAVITLIVNTSLQIWKSKIDREMVRERSKFDIDLSLKKFKLDQEMADWRKRTELAENVLSDFYRARDAIDFARWPGAGASEGKTRPRTANEANDIADAKDSLYVAIERLSNESELFGRINSSKYRFKAIFGSEYGINFERLMSIRNKVMIASGSLVRAQGSTMEYNKTLIERWQSEIWKGYNENDLISLEIDEIINKMENICGPLIKMKPPNSTIENSAFRRK